MWDFGFMLVRSAPFEAEMTSSVLLPMLPVDPRTATRVTRGVDTALVKETWPIWAKTGSIGDKTVVMAVEFLCRNF